MKKKKKKKKHFNFKGIRKFNGPIFFTNQPDKLVKSKISHQTPCTHRYVHEVVPHRLINAWNYIQLCSIVSYECNRNLAILGAEKCYSGDARSYRPTKLKCWIRANMIKVLKWRGFSASFLVLWGLGFREHSDTSFVKTFHFLHQFIFRIVAGCDHLP